MLLCKRRKVQELYGRFCVTLDRKIYKTYTCVCSFVGKKKKKNWKVWQEWMRVFPTGDEWESHGKDEEWGHNRKYGKRVKPLSIY